MKMRAYQELFAKALDLFNEELSSETEVLALLASGNNLWDDDDQDGAWNTAHTIAEQQALAVLPDTYPNEKLMTLLREDPSLIAEEGIGEHRTVREVLLDVVRKRIRRNIFEEAGISTGPNPEPSVAPRM